MTNFLETGAKSAALYLGANWLYSLVSIGVLFAIWCIILLAITLEKNKYHHLKVTKVLGSTATTTFTTPATLTGDNTCLPSRSQQVEVEYTDAAGAKTTAVVCGLSGVNVGDTLYLTKSTTDKPVPSIVSLPSWVSTWEKINMGIFSYILGSIIMALFNWILSWFNKDATTGQTNISYYGAQGNKAFSNARSRASNYFAKPPSPVV